MGKIKFSTTCTRSLADLVTPVGIYLRLRDRFRDTILLESTDFHTAENSWSYICVNAVAGYEALDHQTVEFKFPGLPPEKKKLKGPQDLVGDFNDFLQRFEIEKPAEVKAAQRLFGYTSFDGVQFFENIRFNQNKEKTTSGNLLRYRLYQYVIAINHFKDELYFCENHFKGLESDKDALLSFIYSKDLPVFPFKADPERSSNMSDEGYMDMVKKGIGACHRGDVFQIVLSRRFAQKYQGDDFNVYRALRSINPSPYLFYFDYGDYHLFGSSPESQLLITETGKAILHPIAGTFRRTGDDETDKLAAERLGQDEKETAEHVMLVDLARNDLSRHASGVSVSHFKEVHYYSHVIHLVSEVTGQVNDNGRPIEVMADTFPAGTLSGAPKYKAMQLIDEWEPTRRGYYGGAIGSIGLDGTLTHAIMIRSFMSRGNTLYCQAGAGIVAKSDPASELQEVNNKLNALVQAIELAQTLR